MSSCTIGIVLLRCATALLLLTVSGCHAFQDETAAPLRGRLVLEVVPNPIAARPLGDDWYEMQFDIIMREEGGLGVRIINFTVDAVAVRTITVSTQTYPASYITDRGYPDRVDAGKHLRFSFTKKWQLPTSLLLSGASARITARTVDVNGTRGQSNVRVGVVVGDLIAPGK